MLDWLKLRHILLLLQLECHNHLPLSNVGVGSLRAAPDSEDYCCLPDVIDGDVGPLPLVRLGKNKDTRVALMTT